MLQRPLHAAGDREPGRAGHAPDPCGARAQRVQRREPIVLIALFTEVERRAMFVREADEAVCPAQADGRHAHRSDYLDQGALEEALIAVRADAAWVGWGFVAEDPTLVDLCERLGIVFVGPDPAVMRLVRDKIAAKRLAEKCEIPVAPLERGRGGSRRGGARSRDTHRVLPRGQGRRGRRRPRIRRVDAVDGLAAAFRSARAEGRAGPRRRHAPAGARGSPGPAHRRAGDRGRPGHRMGSDRRARLQPPAPRPERDRGIRQPALTAEHAEILAAARRLALRAGYRNAGTVEFLYEPDARRFSFLGSNPGSRRSTPSPRR